MRTVSTGLLRPWCLAAALAATIVARAQLTGVARLKHNQHIYFSSKEQLYLTSLNIGTDLTSSEGGRDMRAVPGPSLMWVE